MEAVRDAMPAAHQVQATAGLFKVLAHPSRVRLVYALAREELCVCDLAEVLDLTVSAVSHQLRDLRRAELVRVRTEGKMAYYRLSEPVLTALLELGLAHTARVAAVQG